MKLFQKLIAATAIISIENYNNALKSPQSRRLFETIENEVHPDSIAVQEFLPLDKVYI